MHHNVHSSIVYNCQDMQETYVSIYGWIDKEDMVYTHTVEQYSAIRRQIFAICSNIYGLGGYYAEWNKSDRET